MKLNQKIEKQIEDINFCDTEVEREKKKNCFRKNKLFSLVNAAFSRKWDLKWEDLGIRRVRLSDFPF